MQFPIKIFRGAILRIAAVTDRLARESLRSRRPRLPADPMPSKHASSPRAHHSARLAVGHRGISEGGLPGLKCV